MIVQCLLDLSMGLGSLVHEVVMRRAEMEDGRSARLGK